ncbi:hypothetical protein [Ancylobacter defluvii]|uniref:Uncharacterized protein n=1 Tax=Ancylobacter defluvii TaxID=1282440 RepID=A0A9W6N960_9HYPH|nr:hypothetical protein [Ancylobacter defluvii]MBS7587431.1 hypothetical protein [Ancylobacter defluvii]GLK82122.1 hypothetical protein GCM10017653_01910 [Ancylobacter defluvii]
MADYYPLLARAIEQQPNKGREAREVIYARARKALLAQLSGVNPPMAQEDIARQQDFLEGAIRRLEADYGGGDAETASQPETAPVAPPITPPPTAKPPEPEPVAQPVAAKPVSPKPVAPKPPAPKVEEPVAVEPELPGRAPRPRALEDGDADEAEADDLWYRTERPLLDEEAGLDADAAEQAKETRGRRRNLILGAVAAVVLLAGGAAAVLFTGILGHKSEISQSQGGTVPAASTQSAQAPAGAAPEAAGKSTDRVAQAPSAATAQQPVAPPPAVQAAPRAMLLEESAGGGQGLQQFVGNVTWSTETFQPGTGQPQDIGIRALIDIPDRNFKATMTIRRNPDPNIPASHIVEVQFQLPPDFDYGNVSSVPGMQAMASEGAQGAPLRGLAVRVAPGYFLIGLLSGEREQQYNMSLMFSRGFLNVPVVFENGRRAILVVEKGAAGEEAFRTAFTAWGLLRPSQPAQPAQPNGN